MKKILNYLWRIWFAFLAFLFILIFGIPVILLSIKESHFKYAYIFIRLWCQILFYGMGFNYKLIQETSKEIDKNRNYIFISNHTSNIDIMLMCVLHPHHPICFIGKAELAKIPIFNIIYKRICILVDRKDPKSRAEVYVKAAEKMRHGQNIVIFPEGGVPDDTSVLLDTFKDGAFILSTKHNFPIAVYTFAGLKDMFPFDKGEGYPGTVTVYLNDIIEPEIPKDEQKTIARSLVEKTLKSHYSVE